MWGGQGGGGPSFVKQVEAPPDVSQAPGLLQAREKMEGQGLDFPQEPLSCSGTAGKAAGKVRLTRATSAPGAAAVEEAWEAG